MLFLNLKLKKFLLLSVLILFVFTAFSFPLKSQATLPVIDAANLATNQFGNSILYQIYGSLTGITPGERQDSIYKKALYAGLKSLLRQLTQSIVNWINSGFEGSPAFITNTGQFLRNTADITIGDFLMNDPALNFLCDPFKIQIKLSLGLQYRPFQENIRCRLTDALGNVNKAMYDAFVKGDFLNGGGWDSWLKLTTQPQNNQMGAMILAQAELDDRIKKALDIKDSELDWGNGFMSWKDCPDQVDSVAYSFGIEDPNDRFARYAKVTGQKRGDDGCVIKTPGGVIANKINWVDTNTLRELELADDLNEILYALANQLLTMGMNSISGSGLLGNGRPKQDTSYRDYMNYLDTLQKSQASTTATTTATTTPNTRN